MRKNKGIALIGAVLLCITASACVKAPIETVAPSDDNTAPKPPVAAPVGTLREEGKNMLTGMPEAAGEKGKRPLAVMLDNVKAALPQRGISEADIICEMVTESGITRLMAIYSDYTKIPPTGPVRSARDQHVKLMLPLNSLFLHIGSSTYASELLSAYNYNSFSINGLYQPGALRLDSDRAHSTEIEHCWFTDAQLFTSAAEKYELKLNNDCKYSAFNFAQQPFKPNGENAQSVSVRFSSYVTSNFKYSAATERYYKEQFGNAHIDENNGEQLSFDNVIILFTDITKYPDGVLARVRYEYGGVGYYFTKGSVQRVRWMKTADNEPLLIVDADGTEQQIEVNCGKSYVAMVDLDMFEHFKITENVESDPVITSGGLEEEAIQSDAQGASDTTQE